MLADDLLVGNDRWRMTSLAVEPDGSVLMSVVPNAASAMCPCVWVSECSTPHLVSTYGIGLALAEVHRAIAHLGAALLLRRTHLPAEDLCGAIRGRSAALRPPDGGGDWAIAGVCPTCWW